MLTDYNLPLQILSFFDMKINMGYTAVIIIIGDEILAGDVVDTNSHWLAKELRKLGVNTRLFLTLPDDINIVVDFIKHVKNRYDFIFVAGGIGPTPDDITREAIAKVFDVELEVNSDLVDIIKTFFKQELDDKELSMAYLPKGSNIIYDNEKRIFAFHIENIYILPGIPYLLHNIFPIIKERFRTSPIYSLEMLTSKFETEFSDLMKDTKEKFPDVSIGSYPNYNGENYSVKLVFKSRDKNSLYLAKEWFEDKIKALDG
jgi:molybdenum cofactor synthesis domain-containing protein